MGRNGAVMVSSRAEQRVNTHSTVSWNAPVLSIDLKEPHQTHSNRPAVHLAFKDLAARYLDHIDGADGGCRAGGS